MGEILLQYTWKWSSPVNEYKTLRHLAVKLKTENCATKSINEDILFLLLLQDFATFLNARSIDL